MIGVLLFVVLLSMVCAQPACPSLAMQPANELTDGTLSCRGVANGFHKLRVLGGTAAYTFYCFDGRSYLAVNATTNFAEITGAKTSFCAIRVDPASLQVDVGDFTFANTTFDMTKRVGADARWSIATTAPYGFAAACQDSDYLARASIDLSGTAFMISSNITFELFGAGPTGSVMVGESRQVVSLLGGGYCGWTRATHPSRSNYYEAGVPLCAQFGWDLALWPTIRLGNPASNQSRPCGLFRSTCESSEPLPTCAELATSQSTTTPPPTTTATVTLSNPSLLTTSPGTEPNGGFTTTIAIACGVSAAVLLLAGVLACVLCRRKKRDTQQSASAMPMPTMRTSEYGNMSAIQSTSAIHDRDAQSHYGSSPFQHLK
jgi:hypothetical protein